LQDLLLIDLSRRLILIQHQLCVDSSLDSAGCVDAWVDAPRQSGRDARVGQSMWSNPSSQLPRLARQLGAACLVGELAVISDLKM
jgi:hypothetical protein